MVNLVLNKLFSGVWQIIIFSFIPFIWWFFTARRSMSFFNWLGIKKIGKSDKGLWYFVIFIVTLFMGVSVFILSMLSGVETAASEFSGLGVRALPAAFVYAFLNTALSEEILFRGFLLKRLSSKFGFIAGNIIQSLLFGLLHGIMFISLVGTLKAVLVIVFTGAIGWFIGYVNEQKANGSIIPSWMIHGIANLFSAVVSIFSII